MPNECLKYPDNKTFGCGKTVADLEAVTKATDDPTRVFHQTQTCIARKSCDLRCQMDNCKWMDRVIPDFVNPYLQKTGRWAEIESRCQTLKNTLGQYWGDLTCAGQMARYHIDVDLAAALAQTGCGSEADTELVRVAISECTNSFRPLGIPVDSWATWSLRGEAKQACIARRQGLGQNVEIEPSLGGKTCATQ